MNLPLFLVGAVPPAGELTIDGTEGHHAATVVRLRAGESLLVGDGRGTLAEAVVSAARRDTLAVQLLRRWSVEPADPRLVVAQAIAKGDRGELAVQAMTEAGVDEIVPWAAARSVARWRDGRAERSRQRWVDTAREAAKQARRAWVPAVAEAHTTSALVRLVRRAAAALVLHGGAPQPLTGVPLPGPGSGDLIVVVGPEGGITDDELAAFGTAGATPVRMGGTVLRTSTAGVAALAVLSARLGRW